MGQAYPLIPVFYVTQITLRAFHRGGKGSAQQVSEAPASLHSFETCQKVPGGRKQGNTGYGRRQDCGEVQSAPSAVILRQRPADHAYGRKQGAGEEASEEQGGAAPDQVFQGPGSRGKRRIHGAHHAVSEGTEHVPLAGVHELPGECIVVPSPADFGRRHVRGEGKCHLGHIGKQGRARAPGSLAGHLKGSGLRARAAHAGKEAGRQCHAAFITERTGEIFPVTPDQKAGSRLARFSSHGPPRYIWTFFSSR